MKNNLTYTLCGDYYIPNIKLSYTEPIEWNRFSRLARTYLKEHRPILYNNCEFRTLSHTCTDI